MATQKDLEGRYRTLLESMSEGFVIGEAIRDPSGKLVDYWIRYANPVFRRRAPKGQAEVDRRQLELRPTTRPNWFEACERALAGEPVRFEFEDPLTHRWYEVHMMKMSDTEFGQLFVEVTKRKAAERRQAELFNELNHRVKNNLAIVSSILELQARSSGSAAREALEKAVDRIHSVADLHAALYQQNSSDLIDLSPYLQEISERLRRSLLEGSKLTLSTTCEHISTPVAEAVNVGLIVNELVTNAAKYAYGPSGGPIAVTLLAENGGLSLTVADEGKGLPAEGDGRADGLGLRIVRSLAHGLGGEIRTLGGPGARINVWLPISTRNPAAEDQQRLL